MGVAMVTDLWRVSAKLDTSLLYSMRFHSTSNRNIATSIVALTLTISLRLTKKFREL